MRLPRTSGIQTFAQQRKKIREIQDENSQNCRLKKKSTKSEIVRVSRVEARRKTPPKVDTIFSAFDENIRDMNPDFVSGSRQGRICQEGRKKKKKRTCENTHCT